MFCIVLAMRQMILRLRKPLLFHLHYLIKMRTVHGIGTYGHMLIILLICFHSNDSIEQLIAPPTNVKVSSTPIKVSSHMNVM